MSPYSFRPGLRQGRHYLSSPNSHARGHSSGLLRKEYKGNRAPEQCLLCARGNVLSESGRSSAVICPSPAWSEAQKIEHGKIASHCLRRGKNAAGKGKGRDIGYALAANSCEGAISVEYAPSRPLMRSLLSQFQTPTTPRRAVGFFGSGRSPGRPSERITQLTLD
jgi:hypothetical protein